MVVLVDYSVIMHQSWNQIFSDSYDPKCKSEIEEYTRNLTYNIFYISKLFKDSELVLCLDANTNWRHYLVKDYYESRIVLYEDNDPELNRRTFYYPVDDIVYKIEYSEATASWNRGKLRRKVEREDFNIRSQDMIQYKDLEVIQSMDLWSKALEHCVPYYKGQRKLSSFRGNTPKSTWKRLSRELAPKIASALSIPCITEEYAEGDDIIAIAVEHFMKRDAQEEVVVVSVDQDLYQLKLVHPNLSYYNPRNHEIVSISNESVRYKLWCKILGGDKSDNITGVMLDGSNIKEVSWTADGAIKNGISTVNMMEKHINHGDDPVIMYRGLDTFIESNNEDSTYWKNMMLVYLQNIPDSIKDSVNDKLMNRDKFVPKDTISLKDLNMDMEDKVSVINQANRDREEM